MHCSRQVGDYAELMQHNGVLCELNFSETTVSNA